MAPILSLIMNWRKGTCGENKLGVQRRWEKVAYAPMFSHPFSPGQSLMTFSLSRNSSEEFHDLDSAGPVFGTLEYGILRFGGTILVAQGWMCEYLIKFTNYWASSDKHCPKATLSNIELAPLAQPRKRKTGQPWDDPGRPKERRTRGQYKSLFARAALHRMSPTISRHSDFHNYPQIPTPGYRNLVSTTIKLPEFCLPLPPLLWFSFGIGRSFFLVYEPLISPRAATESAVMVGRFPWALEDGQQHFHSY